MASPLLMLAVAVVLVRTLLKADGTDLNILNGSACGRSLCIAPRLGGRSDVSWVNDQPLKLGSFIPASYPFLSHQAGIHPRFFGEKHEDLLHGLVGVFTPAGSKFFFSAAPPSQKDFCSGLRSRHHQCANMELQGLVHEDTKRKH